MNLYVVEELAEPEPASICIFDDVLTTGAHYAAARSVLNQRFPSATIHGIFVARRVFDEPVESA